MNMENLDKKFQEALHKLGVKITDRLLLAVSGGSDSVALSSCARIAGAEFAVAHANFGLRGAESDRDEEFVKRLAETLGVRFYSRKFETAEFAAREKYSIQEAARILRYKWFDELLESESFHYILTAHHQDDNIETLFLHLFRGTGIRGLTGMPEKNGRILRPFLHFPSSELKNFVLKQGLSWVDDSSNLKNDYARNFLRNEIIPSLSRAFPGLRSNMVNNLERFGEALDLYQQAVAGYRKKLLQKKGEEFHIPVLLLKKAHPLNTIVYEILRDFHFTPAQLKDIIQLLDSTNGKFVSSPTHRVIRNRRWLILAPLNEPVAAHFVLEKEESPVVYPGGRMSFKLKEAPSELNRPSDKKEESLDADRMNFPLLLRKWKPGDYFYPLGMKKKKKLSRFLIDQKLSQTEKEKVWVLVAGDRIAWVVGHRIDDRFAIKKTTKKILVLKNEAV